MLSGPFQGLHYLDEIVWGPITPKWLGSYEVELMAIVAEIVATSYATVIDVGCAEGYYAVGLASRLPAAQVYAYDIDFIARRQVRRLADLNSVRDRVRVMGSCDGAELDRRVTEKTLIVCDIEGGERELLDPQHCPSLLTTDLLVEVHENAPGLSTLGLLIERFRPTHTVVQIAACARDAWLAAAATSGVLTASKSDLWEKAVDEHRSGVQTWLWLRRKTAEAASQREQPGAFRR